MRRGASVCLVTALSACSLLTSLDEFTGGNAGNVGDGGGVDAVGLGDGATGDGPGPDDAADASDAGERSRLYSLAVLADMPRGYWRLEEIAGTVAKDETGRNHGIYVAGPLLGERGVAGSYAAKLSSNTNARMRVESTDFRYAGTAPYSVELWAKFGELKDYQWLASTETVGTGNARSGWSILADAIGDIRYEVWRTDPGGAPPAQVRGLTLTSTTVVPGGPFHHLVMVYTGSAVIGYIDGIDKTPFPTTGPAPDTGGQLLWGCRGDLFYCLDDWTIDELAIYDYALGPARVQQHYDLGK
jgi:hypothetical protein